MTYFSLNFISRQFYVALCVRDFTELQCNCNNLACLLERDGLLPRTLAVISARTHVPSRAIIALGAVAIGFAFSGSFDMLTDVIVFMLLAFNGLAVAAIFVLRHRLPDAPRPYRVPAYPLIAGLYLAGTGFLILNTHRHASAGARRRADRRLRSSGLCLVYPA